MDGLNLSGLDFSILAPAFVAGLIVLTTHIPLGREVIRRGIIFIDLAIAQIAGLGIIIAYSFGWDEHGFEAQLFAVATALTGAWILSLLEKKAGQHQEALIGIGFILAATAGILILANNPHAGEHLRELLVGQILWVEWPQLFYAGLISLLVLLCWNRIHQRLGTTGFYLLFACAITVTVQLVGVYLVFASLIIPALATTAIKQKYAIFVAGMIGVTGYGMGLLLSALLDLPSGAVIVWCIALSALFIKFITSQKIKFK
ncbi:MAG: metal ABC transporter permease [Gammaproteobacteria bacterium]|nr:metal ABC transporter permease [Gammaproteobacteria bacterium]